RTPTSSRNDPAALRQQEPNGTMALTEGTANLMQRLSRLPAAPHVDPLLRRKPVPFSLCHKHHLLKMHSYQMVLHRPVETAMDNGQLNPNCTETTNFAFIQRDGIPTGPPGPDTMNNASATPNSQTLLMNQGDRLRITIKDVPGNVNGGVMTMIEDLTTGQSGF